MPIWSVPDTGANVNLTSLAFVITLGYGGSQKSKPFNTNDNILITRIDSSTSRAMGT